LLVALDTKKKMAAIEENWIKMGKMLLIRR
jgi:hypothetical protein